MAEQYPDFFNEVRLQSRERLLEKGVQIYPYSFEYTKTVKQLHEEFDSLLETSQRVCGRMTSQRLMGKAMFIDISQGHDTIQVYVRIDGVGEETFADIKRDLALGDIIGVEGELFVTRHGERTINCKGFWFLSKTVVDIPYGKSDGEKSWYTLSDVEIKRTQRYLDWITDKESFDRFRKRFEITSWIREFMFSKGFLEVLTPTIEPLYGGAEARPFTTTIEALSGATAYLRISPELYLKRYIVGGYEKVFSICQNFRNEGIDSTHNPEFSMMEWYEAWTDYETQMDRFEELTCYLVERLTGGLKIQYTGKEIDFTRPWKRISIPELVATYFGNKPLADITKDDVIGELLKDGLAEKDDVEKLKAESSIGGLVMELVEHRLGDELWGPCFILDHPEDISPLTKAKRGMPGFVERFEPYIAGMEVGNAYSELTDPVEQFRRLHSQREGQTASSKGYEDHPVDYDFIRAIGCGMPPTGGVGFGIERVIMILLDSESIRDVIPFPMRKGV